MANFLEIAFLLASVASPGNTQGKHSKFKLQLQVFSRWRSIFIFCLAIPSIAIFSNVSYGSDPQQMMDVYLPGGRDASVTKVIVVIHGGGWSAGKKEDMNGWVGWFYSTYPRYAIVNLSYRLATLASPAYPKQLEDIQLALQFITTKQVEYQLMPEFGLVGFSAGAHLALLYGYAWDRLGQVNAICNVVGPADVTDPAYTQNSGFSRLLGNLVGNYTYEQNPWIYWDASPVSWITRQSPKTISFYGALDPLIPVSQGTTLEGKNDTSKIRISCAHSVSFI